MQVCSCCMYGCQSCKDIFFSKHRLLLCETIHCVDGPFSSCSCSAAYLLTFLDQQLVSLREALCLNVTACELRENGDGKISEHFHY